MRILILNWRDIKHPLSGGAEVATHEHAKAWIKAGHCVTQFSSYSKGLRRKETIDGVLVLRRGSHYTVHLYAFFYYIWSLRNSTDIVVDQFHFIPFFSPLYIGKKKIAYIHETAENVWYKNSRFPISYIGAILEPLFFWFYRTITFMTVSSSTQNSLIRFGIPRKNICTIHNGISHINSMNKKSTNLVMVYLGRISVDKGIFDSIQAFAKVHAEFGKAQLWIIGKEESKGIKERVQKEIKRLGIEKQIKFYGFVSEKRKFDLLKQAWILVHASIREGWGLNVIEAASQGTPAVAYDSPGLRDSIIDKKTGLLVKDMTAEGLSKGILLLLNNQLLYNSLSRNCLEWSKKFRWSTAGEKSLSLLNTL